MKELNSVELVMVAGGINPLDYLVVLSGSLGGLTYMRGAATSVGLYSDPNNPFTTVGLNYLSFLGTVWGGLIAYGMYSNAECTVETCFALLNSVCKAKVMPW